MIRAFRSRPMIAAIAAAIVLAIVGLATIHDAALAPSLRRPLWIRQLTWLGVGAVAAIAASRVDLRRLGGRRALLLHGGLLLATLATFGAAELHGARRWLHLGPLAVQPSEPLKLGLIVALATCFMRPGTRAFRDLRVPAGIVACSLIPVLMQPDLGTTLVLALVAASMLGAERLSRGVKVALAIGAPVGLLAFQAFGLRAYQRARLEAFLGDDVTGVGYQSAHALRVLGAGGLFGRGAGSFASAEPYPLPEAHGDFVLSVWGHERGFAGVVLVLGLHLAIVLAALVIAARATDGFRARVALGVGALFFWQTALNAGMALGLLPVIGVPLPLVSYGGSSAVTCLVALGLLARVARHDTAAGAPCDR